MTTHTGFAPTNGTSLYYEISGDGDPIVLLHGFSFNHRMWDDQHAVEDFASNGFLQTENPDMAAFAASLKRK
jgi:pimeloyl-ACP methyl ester carboxylesterase